jgi:hypothetical protein
MVIPVAQEAGLMRHLPQWRSPLAQDLLRQWLEYWQELVVDHAILYSSKCIT